MKRLLSVMLLSLGLNMANADNYKVLLVNDASLKYKNGKTVKVDLQDTTWSGSPLTLPPSCSSDRLDHFLHMHLLFPMPRILFP